MLLLTLHEVMALSLILLLLVFYVHVLYSGKETLSVLDSGHSVFLSSAKCSLEPRHLGLKIKSFNRVALQRKSEISQ